MQHQAHQGRGMIRIIHWTITFTLVRRFSPQRSDVTPLRTLSPPPGVKGKANPSSSLLPPSLLPPSGSEIPLGEVTLGEGESPSSSLPSGSGNPPGVTDKPSMPEILPLSGLLHHPGATASHQVPHVPADPTARRHSNQNHVQNNHIP